MTCSVTLEAKEAKILWNGDGFSATRDDKPECLVLPVRQEQSRFLFSDGACCLDWQEAKPKERLLMIFHLFNALVTIYHVPVEQAHQEFLKIKEYKEAVG